MGVESLAYAAWAMTAAAILLLATQLLRRLFILLFSVLFRLTRRTVLRFRLLISGIS